MKLQKYISDLEKNSTINANTINANAINAQHQNKKISKKLFLEIHPNFLINRITPTNGSLLIRINALALFEYSNSAFMISRA